MADDRDAIIDRRRRLIALALAGGAVATACGEACLTLVDTGASDARMDTPFFACLRQDVPTPDASAPGDSAEPTGESDAEGGNDGG